MSIKLSQYRKVSEDKKTTTLEHPKHGTRLTLARETLSPKMKGDLAAMPLYLKDGGSIEDVLDQSQSSSEEPLYSGTMTMPPPPAQAAPTPMVDPHEQAIRQAYNAQLMGDDATMAKAGSTVDNDALFGANGQAPANFNSDAWNKAKEKVDFEANQKAAEAEQTSARIKEQNQARVEAGLPAIPAPEGTKLAQVESMPTPPQANFQGQQQPGQAFNGQANYASVGQQATDGMAQAYGNGLDEVKKGYQLEYLGNAKAARAEAAAAAQQQQQLLELQKHYQDQFQELDTQRKATMQDIQDGHINPKHYLESMSTQGKVGTAIGLMLSGLGSGLAHQDNLASQYIDKQIDRDIDAQKANLGKQENLLSANLKQFGNIDQAMTATRVMQNDIYSAKLKQAAAGATNQLAAAQLYQKAGQLDMQSAPMIQQLAMRRAMMAQMTNGGGAGMDPSMTIKFMAPEGQQASLFKDLKEAQDTSKMKDNVMSAFDQIAKINTLGNRMMSPLQSKSQIEAVRDPILAAMSKGTAGRFTEADAGMLEPLFPTVRDDANTRRVKRAKLNALISEKMNFPSLTPYGINVSSMGRFQQGGQPRFAVQPPVKPKGT